MINVLFSVLEVLSLALQGLLVILLLRGPIRKYFIVFLYSVVYLITSAVEVAVNRELGKRAALYAQVYWTNEILLDVLLFLMVIVLIYQATRETPLRAAVGKLLPFVVVLAAALPFLIGSRPYFSQQWFRLTSQILNFAGSVMNLFLWTALIGSKRRDPQLLLVSAGLGVAVAGQAIYYGIRLLASSPTQRILADLLNVLTYLAGVAIWCWAFRPVERSSSDSKQVATSV